MASPAGGPSGSQQAVPSIGQTSTVSKHQGEALKGYEQRFAALDHNGDGYITQEEAQASPRLAQYWKKQGLGDQGRMDRSAFLKYESTAQTGANVYKSQRSTSGGYPETKHQKEVLESGNQ
jgi:ATP-dependent helicase YprA (DUF1998 family)